MTLGVTELQEWLGTCAGDIRCALAGHAYGNAGVVAWRNKKLPNINFADLFLKNAHNLGWQP